MHLRISNRRTQHLFILWALAAVISLFGAAGTYAQEDDDAAALFEQGQDAHEKGDLVKAVELYRKAIEAAGDLPEAEYQIGNAYRSLGKLDEAERAFRRAAELRPEWSLAFAALGSTLVTRGKYADAGPILKTAIELDRNSFPAYAALTDLLLRTQAPETELKKVLAKITPLAAGAKPPASIWAAKAGLEAALNDRAAAAKSIERAFELEPKDPEIVYQYAAIHLALGDTEKASAAVRTLESLEPNGERGSLLRASLLVDEEKPDAALALLEKLSSPSARVLTMRDKIKAGTTTDVAELKKRIEANARDAAALGRLCSLGQKGDAANTLEYCRRASELEPDNIRHAIGFGVALLQAKQFAAAAELFNKLSTAEPDNTTVRGNLAAALFQLKRFEEAKQQYIRLTEELPENALPFYLLGITYDQLTEYRNAMAAYQQFLRLAKPEDHALEIEKVRFRLPILDRQIRSNKGKK